MVELYLDGLAKRFVMNFSCFIDWFLSNFGFGSRRVISKIIEGNKFDVRKDQCLHFISLSWLSNSFLMIETHVCLASSLEAFYNKYIENY